jgi:hypothetical protein
LLPLDIVVWQSYSINLVTVYQYSVSLLINGQHSLSQNILNFIKEDVHLVVGDGYNYLNGI